VAERRLRPYAPGDETQILALHREVFSHTPTEAAWRRKFIDNPAGPAAIAVVEAAGRIVAHCANNPVRMSFAGQELLAARGVDMMLAPGVRTGLAGPRLALSVRAAVHELITGRAEFNYSTPNPVPSRLLVEHGGLTRAGPVQPVELWLNPAYALRGKPRWKPVTGLWRALGRLWLQRPVTVPATGQPPLVRLDHFDARFDRLWTEAGARYGLTMLRDARFLNWRFGEPGPTRLAVADDERAYGWLVLRTWEHAGWRGAYLVDLAASEAAVAERLLREALAGFRRQGVDVVYAWMMPHAPDWPVMRQLGFRPRPPVLDLLVRTYPGGRLSLDVLKQWDNWHLTLADTEGM
jgi:hypothetical protein